MYRGTIKIFLTQPHISRNSFLPLSLFGHAFMGSVAPGSRNCTPHTHTHTHIINYLCIVNEVFLLSQ